MRGTHPVAVKGEYVDTLGMKVAYAETFDIALHHKEKALSVVLSHHLKARLAHNLDFQRVLSCELVKPAKPAKPAKRKPEGVLKNEKGKGSK